MTIPERIGKYQITEVLGEGSMGVVYKGFDPHIHRPVAIKTIHRALLGDTSAQDSVAARFRNEAQAVGRIVHPGVVAIYEFGEDDSTAYIAMEFVEGRNLDAVLAATPLLPEIQLLRIMDQVLDALACAHAQGVWHRDIKPANLILASSGQVKLTDFGIARIEHAGLTQASSMIGTPAYMAPEQFIGEGIDHRADLFACGVLLYRLLTGQRAFTGGAEAVIHKILNDHPAPPSAVTHGARPEVYDAVVARAMAKRADERYPSAQAMRQALLAISAGTAAAERTAGEDTLVRPPAGWPGWPTTMSAGESAPTLAIAAASGAGTGAMIALAGWDLQELAHLERLLASQVGPMAKVLIREAARSCGDGLELAAALANHIPDDGKRRQFLDVALGDSGVRTGASTIRPLDIGLEETVPMKPQDMAPADPLTEDFRAQALQVLARAIGPIARVMVRRAAERCGDSRERFVQLLLDEAPVADRQALRRELGGAG
jgi:predicted Ser/Thr protein kinase